jgi:hypothetical protein
LIELPEDIRFFLDEGLPEQVANALRMVGYPIDGPIAVNKRGVKDKLLIPWMAENRYAWITKDDEAKRTHLDDVIKSRISSIWVRGIDRRKNKINPIELHLMLSAKLHRVAIEISKAKGPRHYELHLKGEDTPVLGPLDAESLKRKQTTQERRRERRRKVR